jgi:hypothetical protein
MKTMVQVFRQGVAFLKLFQDTKNIKKLLRNKVKAFLGHDRCLREPHIAWY